MDQAQVAALARRLNDVLRLPKWRLSIAVLLLCLWYALFWRTPFDTWEASDFLAAVIPISIAFFVRKWFLARPFAFFLSWFPPLMFVFLYMLKWLADALAFDPYPAVPPSPQFWKMVSQSLFDATMTFYVLLRRGSFSC